MTSYLSELKGVLLLLNVGNLDLSEDVKKTLESPHAFAKPGDPLQ